MRALLALVLALVLVASAYADVKPLPLESIVTIDTTPAGRCTGVIVDDTRNYIVTNKHCTVGAAVLVITLHDGRKFSAAVVSEDPTQDIAVMRIDHRVQLRAIVIADADKVRPGDSVTAIGIPYGGMMVQHGRVLSFDGKEFRSMVFVIEGFSGGPLLNDRYELIGFNHAYLFITNPWTGQRRHTGVALSINGNRAMEFVRAH
jgi:S1-C subfamily serine protease